MIDRTNEPAGPQDPGEAVEGAPSPLRAPDGGTGHGSASGHKLRLDQFLKFRGAVSTGGEAKVRIQSGEVSVNGAIETRRGRGLRSGDRVVIDGREFDVENDLFGDGE